MSKCLSQFSKHGMKNVFGCLTCKTGKKRIKDLVVKSNVDVTEKRKRNVKEIQDSCKMSPKEFRE